MMMGLELLNPWFLLLGLLAIPVALAFLNKRRITHRTVPSLVLLRQLQTEEVTRRRFAIPNHLLALLLYLLALAGVVFASADPVLPGSEPRTVILVLDSSASMNARDVGESTSRFERGVLAIQDDVLGELDGRDRVGLVVAGATQEVVLEPTRDRQRFKEALASVEVGGLTRTIPAALSLAEALCRDARNGEVIVVSDLATSQTWRAPSKCPTRVVTVGEDSPNIAIVELAVREADTLGLLEVYVELLNTGAEPVMASVDLELDGVLAEVLPLEIAAGGQAGRVVKFDAPEGEFVTARLRAKRHNALPDDDVAFAARHRAPKARALVVAKKPGSFAGVALALHDRVELVTIKPDDKVPPGVWDIVFFEDEPGASVLGTLPERSKLVVLGSNPEPFGITRVEASERPAVSWWDFKSPLFQFVDLDAVEIHKARPIVLGEGIEPLVRAGADNALMTRSVWQGREIIALGFRPAESDFVLRVAFANFMANLVSWSGALDRAQPPIKVLVGDVIPGELENHSLIPLAGPDDTPRQASLTEPMRAPGVFELREGEARVGLVVVNLLSGPEASLRPRELPEGMTAFQVNEARESERADWLWRLPLLLAIAFLIIEAILPPLVRRRRAKARAARRRTK